MKYYIISGERSGDLHASNLVKAIRKEDPGAEVRGIGGNYLEEAGAELFIHYREISFMGIAEVLSNLSRIRQVLRKCQQDIMQFRPDVVILVDFAGFNLRVAGFLKAQGIKVYYYISPKIWAWNQSRANKIKKLVDRMFVILPFEKEFYRKFSYEVDYVGNPVYDAISAHVPDRGFRAGQKLSSRPVVAILPGSRQQEVEAMLSCMASIIPSFTDHEFVIAAVSNLPQSYYAPFEAQGIRVVYDQTYDLLTTASAAIVSSGTATLETALFEVPQVVCYRTSAFTYAIGKLLVKVDFISLVNLIAGREVVKELLQKAFTAENLTSELKKILYQEGYRRSMIDGYKEIKTILGSPGASAKAAKLMVKYLKNS